MTRANEPMRLRYAAIRPTRQRALCMVSAFLCLAGLTHPAWAGINAWTSHGPEGAEVHALAVHPTTPGTLYAGQVAGGVSMSSDCGDTWRPMNAGLTDTDVWALAIDPTTPTTLYAGTRGGVPYSGF